MATNHLGHFLLSRLWMDLLLSTQEQERTQQPAFRARLITSGTVTANSDEFGGKVPIPAPADLGDLAGLKHGFLEPVAIKGKFRNTLVEFERKTHGLDGLKRCTKPIKKRRVPRDRARSPL